jgi:hypothetical protein
VVELDHGRVEPHRRVGQRPLEPGEQRRVVQRPLRCRLSARTRTRTTAHAHNDFFN